MSRSGLAILLASFSVFGCDNAEPNSPNRPAAPVETGVPHVTADELKAAVTDQRERAFYEARQWQPVWTNERASALMTAMKDADRHALDEHLFLSALPPTAKAAEREAALTHAALRYAGALSNGIVDPRSVWKIYTIPMNRPDIIDGLEKALDNNELGQWFSSLAPNDPEYKALSEAYLMMRQQAASDRTAVIPLGKAIKPGERDPRIPAIAERLRTNGLLSAAPVLESKANAAVDPTLYTSELAQAVSRIQEDQGLEPNGVIDVHTIKALNLGPANRARMIAINLERRRWLERRPAGTRIDVNLASTMLEYWRGGSLFNRRRVVAGQPSWKTPQLGSTLRRVVANPPWRVPRSIARAEILPKGSAYLRRNNMTIRNGQIVQAPGPRSALGLVKFNLDSPYAIYLHDTPSKQLFGKAERHASHGCIRVQDAVDFARLIADQQGKREAFERALASGRESFVELAYPIAVRLLYHTVYLENGRLVYRHDDYGWDEQVAVALGLGAGARSTSKRYPTDIGP
jgi:murein L,D-transpeptidase YcbB/YkuD